MTEMRWLGKVRRLPWRYPALDTWNRFFSAIDAIPVVATTTEASQSKSKSGKVSLPKQHLSRGET